jgi:hypothetical protein
MPLNSAPAPNMPRFVGRLLVGMYLDAVLPRYQGADAATLWRRVSYGGRKGRRASVRLRRGLFAPSRHSFFGDMTVGAMARYVAETLRETIEGGA